MDQMRVHVHVQLHVECDGAGVWSVSGKCTPANLEAIVGYVEEG